MFCNAGARQADGIDAEMGAEAAVLDGDEGVGDIVGQVFDLDHRALRQAAPRDQAAAIVQDGDVLRRAGDHQIAHIGQAGKEMRKEHARRRSRPRPASITST